MSVLVLFWYYKLKDYICFKIVLLGLKKYINNISALQFFQLLRFGTLFAISIFYSKSSLSQSEIGNYEYFLFLAGAVSFFWVSGVIQSMLPLYGKDDKEKKSPLLFNAFVLISLFSVVIAIIVGVFGSEISALSGNDDGIPYLWLFVLFILFANPAFLTEYVYLLNNKTKSIFIYGTVSFSLQLIAVVLPVLLGYDLIYAISALVGINILRFIWLIYLLSKYSVFKISKQYLSEHIKLGTPLILSALLSGSAQYIDGFLVSFKFDESTFAVFRYGARELPFVVILANAFSNAMIPEFSGKDNLSEVLNRIKVKSGRLMHILFPITILLLLISNYLYPIVFNPDFSYSAKIFNIYLLLIVSRLLFPQTILIGLRKTKIIMTASLIELIINIGLSVIFINLWGIIGVAYATVIAYAFEKLFLIYYVKTKADISPDKYINIRSILIYSSVTVLVYFLIEFVVL